MKFPLPLREGLGEGAVPSNLLVRAVAMRRSPTPAECALWHALRRRQIGGMKFRRQAPIGPFIVDFYCPPARLVVEVDGETHAESVTDPARDSWLRAQGLRVLRFWNNEVLGNLDGMLSTIFDAVRATRPLTPPARGECSDETPPPLAGGARGGGR